MYAASPSCTPKRPDSPRWIGFFRFRLVHLLSIGASLFASSIASGQDIILDEGKKFPRRGFIVLPYTFASETWDVAFGVAAGGSGWLADTATTYGAVTGSTNGTWNVTVGGNGYPTLLLDRLYVDFFATYFDYTNLQDFLPGNPAFLDSPDIAGSNDSSPDNFFRAADDDLWLQATFRYVLPIGDNRESAIQTYDTDRGMLVSRPTGGEVWNPLTSGRTSILIRPYYRDQDVVLPETNAPYAFETLNVQLGLEYDNRNFRANPSKGSYQMIALTRDWGALGDVRSWTFGEIELSQYFDIGESNFFRQQVIGLNAWTGYSFTWREVDVPGLGPPVAVNRPPYFTGATLGGFNRMRAYPGNRFNGRAASYFSAEYRVIPHWRPFAETYIDEVLDLDWWQISLFFETGRVADSYSPELFYEDLQFDAGMDFRFFIRNSVVRVGTAVAADSWQFVTMFGQPF